MIFKSLLLCENDTLANFLIVYRRKSFINFDGHEMARKFSFTVTNFPDPVQNDKT